MSCAAFSFCLTLAGYLKKLLANFDDIFAGVWYVTSKNWSYSCGDPAHVTLGLVLWLQLPFCILYREHRLQIENNNRHFNK